MPSAYYETSLIFRDSQRFVNVQDLANLADYLEDLEFSSWDISKLLRVDFSVALAILLRQT